MSFTAILTFKINLRVLLVENYWSEQSGKDEGANLKRRPLELQKYHRNLHKIIQKKWRIPVSAIITLEEGREGIIMKKAIIHSKYFSISEWLKSHA